jgi:hypothetical protein
MLPAEASRRGDPAPLPSNDGSKSLDKLAPSMALAFAILQAQSAFAGVTK